MKHTVSLGNGRFLRLDSYGESSKTRAQNTALSFVFVLIIAVITVPALVGIDITTIQPIQTNGNLKP